MTAGDLPVIEFAFPGPLRDQLVAATLAGEKTTTTGLLVDYERENEPLPAPGSRQVVIDSAGRPAAGPQRPGWPGKTFGPNGWPPALVHPRRRRSASRH
jgi:hypothetical protein